MAKLHEVLAVEEDRRGKANKIISEGVGTFKNKQQHFIEQKVIFKPFGEDEEDRVEGSLEMVDTVKSKLKYITDTVAKYYDVFYQKEKTNSEAKADIVLSDGTTFLKDVPATALLALEKEIAKLAELYDSLPTLEPAVDWKATPDKGDDYRLVTSSKLRTKKVMKAMVLYEATKEHPAQVKEYSEDVPVGDVVTTVISSKLTSKEKSAILDRLDNLKTSIKKARMRANMQDVAKANIGAKIFKYINEGTLI